MSETITTFDEVLYFIKQGLPRGHRQNGVYNMDGRIRVDGNPVKLFVDIHRKQDPRIELSFHLDTNPDGQDSHVAGPGECKNEWARSRGQELTDLITRTDVPSDVQVNRIVFHGMYLQLLLKEINQNQ